MIEEFYKHFLVLFFNINPHIIAMESNKNVKSRPSTKNINMSNMQATRLSFISQAVDGALKDVRKKSPKSFKIMVFFPPTMLDVVRQFRKPTKRNKKLQTYRDQNYNIAPNYGETQEISDAFELINNFDCYEADLIGGWRRIVDELDLKGGVDIVIECGDFSRCYLAAQDNGRFVVGARHFTIGEPPSPEEILSLIKTPDDPKMSLKTGFGKYVGVDSEGILVAMADAIGPRERFELIFQDGKSALQSSSSNLFLKMNPVDDDFVRVCSRVVGEHEIVNEKPKQKKSQNKFLILLLKFGIILMILLIFRHLFFPVLVPWQWKIFKSQYHFN